jgi:hypothetical protein
MDIAHHNLAGGVASRTSFWRTDCGKMNKKSKRETLEDLGQHRHQKPSPFSRIAESYREEKKVAKARQRLARRRQANARPAKNTTK